MVDSLEFAFFVVGGGFVAGAHGELAHELELADGVEVKRVVGVDFEGVAHVVFRDGQLLVLAHVHGVFRAVADAHELAFGFNAENVQGVVLVGGSDHVVAAVHLVAVHGRFNDLGVIVLAGYAVEVNVLGVGGGELVDFAGEAGDGPFVLHPLSVPAVYGRHGEVGDVVVAAEAGTVVHYHVAGFAVELLAELVVQAEHVLQADISFSEADVGGEGVHVLTGAVVAVVAVVALYGGDLRVDLVAQVEVHTQHGAGVGVAEVGFTDRNALLTSDVLYFYAAVVLHVLEQLGAGDIAGEHEQRKYTYYFFH